MVPATSRRAGLRALVCVGALTCVCTEAAADSRTAATTAPVPELELSDSVSCGAVNRGGLSDAAELPTQGYGYLVVDPWLSRQRNFGTTELVSLLVRAAGIVAETHPGAILSVGDLSVEHGGPIDQHRSHQSGRDADLIFYAIDADGQPFAPDQHMAVYRPNGSATYAESPAFVKGIPLRFFDLPRNWTLVRALITDPHANVTHIFVSRQIRTWLLRYAERIGETEEVLARARQVFRRSGVRSSHNDHMHIRISCSADDIAMGRCREEASHRRRRFRGQALTCPQMAEPPLAQR